MSTDYSKLEESYRELEQLKDSLQHKEETWKLNMTDAQKGNDNTKSEVGSTMESVEWKQILPNGVAYANFLSRGYSFKSLWKLNYTASLGIGKSFCFRG